LSITYDTPELFTTPYEVKSTIDLSLRFLPLQWPTLTRHISDFAKT
jgi:hypothetical protein